MQDNKKEESDDKLDPLLLHQQLSNNLAQLVLNHVCQNGKKGWGRKG